LIVNSVLIDTSESLHDMKRFALGNAFNSARRGARCDPSLIVVVRRVDDKRVSVPASPRIAIPQFNARRQMGTAIKRDDPRVMDHLVKNDDISGHLNNLICIVVAGWKHSAGYTARDAAIPDAHVLIGVGIMSRVEVALRFGFGLD